MFYFRMAFNCNFFKRLANYSFTKHFTDCSELDETKIRYNFNLACGRVDVEIGIIEYIQLNILYK